jgi:membrane-bound lytic murein transglycosylase B
MNRLTLHRVAAALLTCVPLAGLADTKAGRDTSVVRTAARVTPPAGYGEREDLMRFADEMAQRNELDPAWVRKQLAGARYIGAVARLIMPAPVATAKNWAAYRARFIEPVRLRAGVEFWNAHEAALARAEAMYGVPAAIVVGLIGVETIYGQHTGGFRVIDALATLAFDFPAGRKDRSGFFRDELEQLFVLAQRAGLNPSELKGSYAGAMGLPQFMPSSWNRYAVDFDDDGRIDLLRSPADAIGSVANYLAKFGWSRDMPAYFTVTPPADMNQRGILLEPDIVPTFSVEDFLAHGAQLAPAAHGFAGKLALVELLNAEAPPTHVAGTQNFYAITRYNWSSYYALAVIELGAELAKARSRR